MQKQHIRTFIKSILSSQKGTILVLLVYIVVATLILSFGMIEVGKVMIAKEKLQTAADATSLAAAGNKEAYREVEIIVHTTRGSKWRPPTETSNGVCTNCANVSRRIKGMESELIGQGEWHNYCVSPCPDSCGNTYDCWYEVKDRRFIYKRTLTHAEKAEIESEKSAWKRDVEKDLADDLIYAVSYDDERYIRAIVSKSPSLESIKRTLRNRDNFASKYAESIGYKGSCSYYCSDYAHYTNDYTNCLKKTSACQDAKYDAKKVYDRNIDKLLSVVSKKENTIAQIDRMGQNLEPVKMESYGNIFVANKMNENYVSDARIQQVKTYSYEKNKSSPYYPSVAVLATAKVKNWFYNSDNKLLSFGEPEWLITVCSQSATSYRDPDDIKGEKFYDSSSQSQGSWVKIPKDVCEYWRKEKSLP